MAIVAAGSSLGQHFALRSMFKARKKVFVDLLEWNVPVVDGLYEIDQFDDERATYVIVSDECGRHKASARLLQTLGPHILGDLFPELCNHEVPRGLEVREITRFCIDPGLGTDERREARKLLISALVDEALAAGVRKFTAVAELAWMRQVLAFGWSCQPLGLPREIGGTKLGALGIDIDERTPGLLAREGIYLPQPEPARRAA